MRLRVFSRRKRRRRSRRWQRGSSNLQVHLPFCLGYDLLTQTVDAEKELDIVNADTKKIVARIKVFHMLLMLLLYLHLLTRIPGRRSGCYSPDQG